MTGRQAQKQQCHPGRRTLLAEDTLLLLVIDVASKLGTLKEELAPAGSRHLAPEHPAGQAEGAVGQWGGVG
jgi:hypothetical protein